MEGRERISTAHQLARDSRSERRDKAILAQSNRASITVLIGHLGKVPIINRPTAASKSSKPDNGRQWSGALCLFEQCDLFGGQSNRM